VLCDKARILAQSESSMPFSQVSALRIDQITWGGLQPDCSADRPVTGLPPVNSISISSDTKKKDCALMRAF